MKHFLRICFAISFCCCCAGNIFSQSGAAIDRYLGTTANLTTIGSASDKLSVPQDLNFSPVPSRKNELWVVNYGTYNLGGNVVIFYNAGKPTQWSEKRHDSHSAHFMLQPTALAMGSADSGYFATIGDALNSRGNNTDTYIGPALWDSDTSKFARINQNDWVTGQPLGSHIDMLHQSPYSMGIAFDTLNAYWIFDGYHGCLFHYDFQTTHGYGGDDHTDGIILKYKEVKLKRSLNLPSHMVVDRSTGWLYIVDNGNKRIVRVDTRSGQLGNDVSVPNEILQQYSEMVGVKWQTIDSGFTNLSGIAYFDGRLIVGNYGNGDIRVYNTTTSPKPTYLGTIKTNDTGMVGMRIGPDSNIWYVNRTKNQVIKLTPGGIAPVDAALLSPGSGSTQVAIPASLSWMKTPGATSYHLQVSLKSDFTTTVYDSSGITVTSMSFPNLNNSTTYYWRATAKNAAGEGKWTSVWNFKTIGGKPDKVVLMLPTDAAQNVPTFPMLMWDSLKVSTSYDLQISTWNMFATTLIDKQGIINNSYTLTNSDPKLDAITQYYWRVRSRNDGTIGDWSDTWSFITNDPASVKENPSVTSKITVDGIYPNPSSTNSTVDFTLSQPLHLRVAILDITGKEINILSNENYESGQHSLAMNSALPSGTYFYQFRISEGIILKPFIINK